MRDPSSTSRLVQSRLRRYYRLTVLGAQRLAQETARMRDNVVAATARLPRAGLSLNPFSSDGPVGPNPGQWLVLALTPILTLTVAVTIVHRREQPRLQHAPATES